MAGFWPTPQAHKTLPIVAEHMNNLPKVVFSRTLDSSPPSPRIRLSDFALVRAYYVTSKLSAFSHRLFAISLTLESDSPCIPSQRRLSARRTIAESSRPQDFSILGYILGSENLQGKESLPLACRRGLGFLKRDGASSRFLKGSSTTAAGHS
jgi:hypothetical protein